MALTTVPLEPLPVPVRHQDVKRQLSRIILAVACLDGVVIVVATLTAFTAKFGASTTRPPEVEYWTGMPLVDFGWMIPVWVASLIVHDAYSTRQFARGADEFKTVLKGSFFASAAIAMIAYFVNYDMSRSFYLLTFVLGTALLLLERHVVRQAVLRQRASSRLLHRVVIYGTGESIAELSGEIDKNRELGFVVVGSCTVGQDPVELCKLTDADTLVVTGGSFSSSADLRCIGWQLGDSDIDLIVVPSLLDVAGPRIHMRPVAGLPLMHIEPPQAAGAMRWGKAVFDRVVALTLLMALAPVFATVAAAVRVESPGPVFFRHRRVGAHGSEFDVWKFRSMVTEASDQHNEMIAAIGTTALLFKVKDDPRVTRVGRFIRRYSLDELPQLVNVLLGQMSLVGPRPQVAAEVAGYDETAHRRLLVRPGITGLWQVSGRSDLTWEEAVRLDLSYVDNWSMTSDIVILARTVRAVLRHDGAY